MDDDNKNINSDIDENDSVIESDDIVSEEDENTPRLIAKLREKLKECESEKQENLNGWQRTKADFVNLKKRSEEENREFIKYANNRLIEEIIPVLESFEMAFSNKKFGSRYRNNGERGWNTSIINFWVFSKGMDLKN